MSLKKTIFIVVIILTIITTSMLVVGRKGNKNYLKLEFIDGFDKSIIESQLVEIGKSAIMPENPKHDDYVFVGWYLDEEKTQEVKDFSNIKENLRVYALYEDDKNNNGIVDNKDKTYKVTFVDNVTQNILDTQFVLSSTNATAPEIPNHEGYTFLGWNKGYTEVKTDIIVTTNFKENIEENDETKEHEAIFIVTFVDGDTGNVFAIQNVQEGMSASLPETPKHEGRVFKSWTGEYRNITSNKTITAEYTKDLNNDGIADNLQPLEDKM